MSARIRRGGAAVALMGGVLFALLLACGANRPAEAPTVLRVGVLPDEAPARLRSLYDPLLAYLASATGLDCELQLAGSYEQLLEDFDAGALDLVWFGGLTFSWAQLRSGAEPLVSRDIDVRFTTMFVTASADGDSVDAFAGKPMAFGPRLSTSGHLMARDFLETSGIDAESLFAEVRYSSGHDETLQWVRDGVVAIGAVNAQVAQAAFRAGWLDAAAVRIVATTPPYQNYVWATRRSLDPRLRRELRGAFLALDPAVPEHAALLEPLGAGGFVPVGPDAYLPLQRVARKVGLLEAALGEDRT